MKQFYFEYVKFLIQYMFESNSFIDVFLLSFFHPNFVLFL